MVMHPRCDSESVSDYNYPAARADEDSKPEMCQVSQWERYIFQLDKV